MVQGIRGSREDVSSLATSQIYGVDVALHLWERHEKNLLFFSHHQPPYPECTLRSYFFSLFSSILHAMLIHGTARGSYMGEKQQ